jgi:hypothetical protein
MQVFGPTNPAPTPFGPQIVGAPSANTTLSYGDLGNTFANAFDGNINTYFDAPDPDGNWIQLDLGSPRTIGAIKYSPRIGFESRMIGGTFEVSNDPTFATGVVTLGTVTTTPAEGLTVLTVSVTGTYRYVRYVAPDNSNGDIAEMQVFGAGKGSSSSGGGSAGAAGSAIISGTVALENVPTTSTASPGGFVVRLTQRLHGKSKKFTTTTSSSGGFSFSGLQSGATDTVQIVKRKGYKLAHHTHGSYVVKVTNGQVVSDLLFSEVPLK